MDFDEYQQQARATAIYPKPMSNTGLCYTALGLAGEAGEVADQVKRILRDDNGQRTLDRRAEILNELGDVLWYASQVCSEIGVKMSAVAQFNLDKLAARQMKNTLKGDGDR